VQVTEVADPEQLSRHPGEARPEGQVVAPERDVDHVGAVRDLRDHDGTHRVRVPLGSLGAEFESPCPYGGAHALRHPMMAREHVVEPLPGQHRKSTRLNSSHVAISYAVFCLKKKKPHSRPGPITQYD